MPSRRPTTAWLRTAATTAALAALTLTLAACGGSADPAAADATTAAGAPVNVVASTDVYGSIAKAVGGDRVAVTSIIDNPDADPHEYETTPADAVAVNSAKIVIVNGAGYDDFAVKLLAAASSKPTTINVADLSGLQASTPAGQEFNEHLWYSLPTVKKLADQLATDLGAADAADAATFTANAAAFKAKVDGLIAKLDALKAKHAGDKVAITEPVPLYMVDAAGLTNATPPEFSEAAEEGTDPPAAVLNETLALFTGKTVRVLLPNSQTESPSTTQAEQAATAAGIPIVKVTETLPAGTTDYIAWQTQQVDALTAALG